METTKTSPKALGKKTTSNTESEYTGSKTGLLPSNFTHCFWIAVIGLALEGCAGEFLRFSVPPSTPAGPLEENVGSVLCLLCIIATLFFARRLIVGFVFKSRLWAFGVCIAFSAGLFLYFHEYLLQTSSAPVSTLGYYLVVTSAYLYMLIWFERIFRFGLKATLLTVCVGLLVRGCFQALLLFMREVPSTCFLIVMPLASLPCLLRIFSESEHVQGTLCSQQETDKTAFVSEKNSTRVFVAILIFLFFLSSLTMLANKSEAFSGDPTQLWSHGQVLCILANIVAGLILLVFASGKFNRTYLLLFFFTCVALSCIALYGATTLSVLSESSNLVCALALRITRKALDFAVTFPAFIFFGKNPAYYRYVTARLSTFFGNCLIRLFLLLFCFFEQFSTVFIVVCLVGLFVPLALLFLFLADDINEAKNTAEEPVIRKPFQETLDLIADEAALTPTETAVFRLLARGHNADGIRQELVISINTAKTHIRNVYLKLDVHSHQELMSIINDRKKEVQGNYE